MAPDSRARAAPLEEITYLQDFMILFRPGHMVRFKPIDRAGYDQIVDDVANGRFKPRIRPVTFVLDDFHQDTARYARNLEGALDGD